MGDCTWMLVFVSILLAGRCWCHSICIHNYNSMPALCRMMLFGASPDPEQSSYGRPFRAEAGGAEASSLLSQFSR